MVKTLHWNTCYWKTVAIMHPTVFLLFLLCLVCTWLSEGSLISHFCGTEPNCKFFVCHFGVHRWDWKTNAHSAFLWCWVTLIKWSKKPYTNETDVLFCCHASRSLFSKIALCHIVCLYYRHYYALSTNCYACVSLCLLSPLLTHPWLPEKKEIFCFLIHSRYEGDLVVFLLHPLTYPLFLSHREMNIKAKKNKYWMVVLHV